ncbi:hypothetical protein [Streptomyces sp. NPDC012888]|uniref:hypothetical protein n=1 Tax=Streptomyces sp. NPDC012888 TaxID=3364855 RepID=UPI0036A65E90
MTPCSIARGRVRRGTVRALACVATLAAVATGCRDDRAPDWGYPDLRATLRTYSAALAEPCDDHAPAHCAAGLDRLGVLAERAFGEVLDHRLLDDAYVAARSAATRAREARLAAAAEARARHDPHHPSFRRAVAAERLAHARLLAELERIRTAPPPGDGTEPV